MCVRYSCRLTYEGKLEIDSVDRSDNLVRQEVESKRMVQRLGSCKEQVHEKFESTRSDKYGAISMLSVSKELPLLHIDIIWNALVLNVCVLF